MTSEGSSAASGAYVAGMLRTIAPTDESLATRVGERDIEAFASLYDRYAPRIYTWAVRVLGAAEADDVLQEVFIRLWDRATQFDARRGSFAAWFAAVTRHEMVSRLRRRGREHRAVVSEEIDELLAHVPDPREPPDALAWRSERAASLAAAVRALPPEQRRVIVMAYFGGLTQREIATALAAPLGTVKKRTALALAKLRRTVVADMRAENA